MSKQEVHEILAERQGTHGSFDEASVTVQRIKSLMRCTPNWDKLSSAQREALEMTQHKIGRILYGDPNHLDSWQDAQGYMKLGEPK